MAEIKPCEPSVLYNLLNRSGARLAEINYLCLIDARETQDYRTSHIITAKTVKTDSEGVFLLPEALEVDSMQHVVVYDSNTSSIQEHSRALLCARVLSEVSLSPVLVVIGGFQRFSALYTYLRTEKIMYTITELESLKQYPVEILSGLLYLGDEKQSADCSLLREMKISLIILLSQQSMKGNQTIVNFRVDDSVKSDLYSIFERICDLIASTIDSGSRVLIASPRGRSRCSAVTIAFLMKHRKHTLQEAWSLVLGCKPDMRPNAGFLQQLEAWELHLMGRRETDTSLL
ncbi:serine/threonine/tyrosine-interacting-like protein 1 [Gymnodraco acuticeps]|uniref:Serine/threonine/tyrosine-interacting-like protein 1 n=1 Tax=Gymnodraco acuticeps TaxID=8218 RepID=A0A6P8UK57_GYMAC|nr:serine/threonine/tyrosine-interacting-like protein 1 [Gymnodraco acuticeps]